MKGKETLFVLCVGAALFGAFYLIVYRPSSGKIEKLKSGVQRYQSLDFKEKVVEETHLKKLREVEALKQEIDKLKTRLLVREEEDSFIRELRTKIASAGVSDDSVKRMGPVAKGDRDYVAFKVRLKGLFRNVYSFLRSVEDMDKNVWLDKIGLSRLDGDRGLVALDLDLSVPLAVGKE